LGAVAFVAFACAAETIRVAIDKLKFGSAQVSADLGDAIELVNSDFIAHAATARNQDWDVVIPAKETGSITLQRNCCFSRTFSLAQR